MKAIIFIILLLILLGCNNTEPSKACENIDCSTHGKCEIKDDKASCKCDDDFTIGDDKNLTCINSKMVDCLSSDVKNATDSVVQVEVTYGTISG